MTKENLEKIRAAEKSIASKRMEIEALLYKASGAGAIRYDKDRVQTSPQDFMTMAIADAIKLEKQINKTEAKIEEMKCMAYSIVRQMDKVEQRAVIEWFYLNGLSMKETAMKLHMSERSAYYLKDDAIKVFVEL